MMATGCPQDAEYNIVEGADVSAGCEWSVWSLFMSERVHASKQGQTFRMNVSTRTLSASDGFLYGCKQNIEHAIIQTKREKGHSYWQDVVEGREEK